MISNNVWGGGERYAFDLSRRLRGDGADVRLVTRGSEAVDGKLKEAGLPISHAPMGGIFDLQTSREIVKAAEDTDKAERIIIHAHDFKMAFHAVKSKKRLQKRGWKDVRVVVTRHLVKAGKRDLINRYVYEGTDAAVFVSECARRVFSEGNPPMNAKKIHVIGNSLTDVPAKVDKEMKNADETVKLLYLGRLSPEKGVELLLESLSLIKEQPWHLEAVGTGKDDYVSELREKSRSLGISDRISWSGYVSEVWPSIRRADIGVVPTIVPEAFGLSILEFLSQGVPVVSTDTGAQPEILTDGRDGKLCAPDAANLADALSYLIQNRDERERMGANAVSIWKGHDYDSFYSQIKKVYEEC